MGLNAQMSSCGVTQRTGNIHTTRDHEAKHANDTVDEIVFHHATIPFWGTHTSYAACVASATTHVNDAIDYVTTETTLQLFHIPFGGLPKASGSCVNNQTIVDYNSTYSGSDFEDGL